MVNLKTKFKLLKKISKNGGVLTKEDQDIVLSVQKGIKSKFYNRGRYSLQHEIGVHHFHRLICKAIN